MGRKNNKRGRGWEDEADAQRIAELERQIREEEVRRAGLQRQVAAVLQIRLQPLATAYLNGIENERVSSQSTHTQNALNESTSLPGLLRFGLTRTPPPSTITEEPADCAPRNSDDEEDNNTLGKGPTR